MFFSATELEHHPLFFDVAFQPGEIGFAEGVRQNGVLRTEGKVELLRNTLGEIRISGNLKVDLEAACDRCLEPAPLPLDDKFDLFYRPVPKISGHPEMRIEEGEVDISFYEGDGFELKDVLREFVLLCLPMRITCQPDCKGICPQCGQNRNLAACNCATPKLGERLAALRNL